MSHTVTVGDFLGAADSRSVDVACAADEFKSGLNGALQFAVDIHPLTNLAVIADTANGRVLFIPCRDKR